MSQKEISFEIDNEENQINEVHQNIEDSYKNNNTNNENHKETLRSGNEKKGHLILKIKKDEKSTMKVLEKVQTETENYLKLSKLNDINNKKASDLTKIIKDLNDEISRSRSEYLTMKSSLEKVTREKNNYEADQKKVADYCNDLKKKFKNFNETISNYEEIIQMLIQESKDNDRNYGEKIFKLNKIKSEIERENQSLHGESESLTKAINQSDIEYNLLIRSKADQKELFIEKERIYKLNNDELERRYAKLQKMLNDIELNHSRENTAKNSSNKVRSMKNFNYKEMEEIERKIKESKTKNEELTRKLRDIKLLAFKKVTMMNEALQQSAEVKKFLGRSSSLRKKY